MAKKIFIHTFAHLFPVVFSDFRTRFYSEKNYGGATSRRTAAGLYYNNCFSKSVLTHFASPVSQAHILYFACKEGERTRFLCDEEKEGAVEIKFIIGLGE